MKKIFLLMLIVPLFAGCDALSDLTKIPVPISQTFTIPALTPANTEIPITTPEIETNIDSIMSVYNINSDVIESVTFEEMKLSVSSGTLDYLSSIEVDMTVSDSTQGEITKKIAWIDVPENAGTSLTLTVSGDDLKDYILKEKFKLTFKVKTDEVLSESKDILANMKFELDLKVLGL